MNIYYLNQSKALTVTFIYTFYVIKKHNENKNASCRSIMAAKIRDKFGLTFVDLPLVPYAFTRF